jgi:hypothetical protein
LVTLTNFISAKELMQYFLILGRVKYPLAQPQEFDSDYSYAWSTSFQGEIIDGRSGRPVTGYEIKLIIETDHVFFLF